MKKSSLIDLLRMMETKDASDIHLKSNCVPVFRIKGEITRLQLPEISEERLRYMISETLSEKEVKRFEDTGTIDTAVAIPRTGRFRLNVFMQRGTITLVARRISYFIPNFEELNLPESVSNITNFLNGLVLITGATGSGKSSTLASVINHINKNRKCHILCIEDPIEFLYQDEQAIINQREIGIDVPTFEDALKYAMREDPDVMLVGEMRDKSTVEFALHGAETGHLVFGTLHSSNASQTIGRILNFFPQNRHEEIRKSLGADLRAVISQMLLPSSREGVNRVPACEILFVNPIVSRLIIEGNDSKLIKAMKAARQEGMQDFEQALVDLKNNEFITEETALKFAENPHSLRMKLNGIMLNEEGGSIIG